MPDRPYSGKKTPVTSCGCPLGENHLDSCKYGIPNRALPLKFRKGSNRVGNEERECRYHGSWDFCWTWVGYMPGMKEGQGEPYAPATSDGLGRVLCEYCDREIPLVEDDGDLHVARHEYLKSGQTCFGSDRLVVLDDGPTAGAQFCAQGKHEVCLGCDCKCHNVHHIPLPDGWTLEIGVQYKTYTDQADWTDKDRVDLNFMTRPWNNEKDAQNYCDAYNQNRGDVARVVRRLVGPWGPISPAK